MVKGWCGRGRRRTGQWVVEISHSRSRSPIPATSMMASENCERMVRERREENRAMGSVEISCSQSPIPAASTTVSEDGERLVRERREENGRRWGAQEWVPSRSRRRRPEAKMVKGWCGRGGANRREENDRRWGAREWVPSRSRRRRQRGRDGERLVRERRENDRRWGAREWVLSKSGRRRQEVEMVEGWCERGGVGEEGGERQEMGGSKMSSVQIWEATKRGGDGERQVWERRDENDRIWGLGNGFCPNLRRNNGKRIWWKAEKGRRWGLENGIWEVTKAKMDSFTDVKKEN